MERVKLEKGQVKLRINEKIYDSDSIKETKSAFSKYCEISSDKEGDFTVLTLKPRGQFRKNLESIGYEFFNYLLGIVKKNRVDKTAVI